MTTLIATTLGTPRQDRALRFGLVSQFAHAPLPQVWELPCEKSMALQMPQRTSPSPADLRSDARLPRALPGRTGTSSDPAAAAAPALTHARPSCTAASTRRALGEPARKLKKCSAARAACCRSPRGSAASCRHPESSAPPDPAGAAVAPWRASSSSSSGSATSGEVGRGSPGAGAGRGRRWGCMGAGGLAWRSHDSGSERATLALEEIKPRRAPPLRPQGSRPRGPGSPLCRAPGPSAPPRPAPHGLSLPGRGARARRRRGAQGRGVRPRPRGHEGGSGGSYPEGNAAHPAPPRALCLPCDPAPLPCGCWDFATQGFRANLLQFSKIWSGAFPGEDTWGDGWRRGLDAAGLSQRLCLRLSSICIGVHPSPTPTDLRSTVELKEIPSLCQ